MFLVIQELRGVLRSKSDLNNNKILTVLYFTLKQTNTPV